MEVVLFVQNTEQYNIFNVSGGYTIVQVQDLSYLSTHSCHFIKGLVIALFFVTNMYRQVCHCYYFLTCVLSVLAACSEWQLCLNLKTQNVFINVKFAFCLRLPRASCIFPLITFVYYHLKFESYYYSYYSNLIIILLLLLLFINTLRLLGMFDAHYLRYVLEYCVKVEYLLQESARLLLFLPWYHSLCSL